jgi:hypothetical protein
MDPGSSAGRSGGNGRESERGRPGRGLNTEADLGHATTYGGGERSMSLKAACRVDAALARVML